MKSPLYLIIVGLSLCVAQTCRQTDAGDEVAAALLLLRGGLFDGSSANPCPAHTATTPSGTVSADVVVEAAAATGSGFGAKECLTNGVRGEGEYAGSLDVFSMHTTGSGAVVVLAWSDRKVTNGAGADFAVFENAFKNLNNTNETFLEAVIVEVSENETTKNAGQWCGFGPNYTGTPETSYSSDASHWGNFAGRTPVKYHQESNPLNAADLFDASKAGGDGFDLSNLSDSNTFSTGCSTAVRNSIQANGFWFLRLVSATSRTNPDTGSAFLAGSLGGSPDIDGVIARYVVNR